MKFSYYKIKDKLTLLANIATVIGLILAFWIVVREFPLIKRELQELNSKARLEVVFKPATTTIRVGLEFTEPFRTNVVLRNIGDRSTDFSEIAIFFCDPIKVANLSPGWNHPAGFGENSLWMQLEKDIIYDRAFFFDEKDAIGYFDIILPSKNSQVALIHTSGKNTESRLQLISFDWQKKEFDTEIVLTDDGSTHPSLESCILSSSTNK